MLHRYIMIFFVGTHVCALAHAQIDARDTLQLLTQHIIHREPAAFMRFDQRAFDIMDRPDSFGTEMKEIYNADLARVYKASVRQSVHAPFTFNPLFMASQADLIYCTRFLKLLKKHTSLVMCDIPMPEELLRALFKPGTLFARTEQIEVEALDSLVRCCDELLGKTDTFTIVVTSLRGVAPMLQYRLMQLKPNILFFDIDVLFRFLAIPMQTLINAPQFYRLMAKNVKCICIGDLKPETYQEEKDHYIHVVQALHFFGIEPSIVECSLMPPTFLDVHWHDVLYMQSDPARPKVNIDTEDAINAYIDAHADELHPEDIIIGISSDYTFTDDTFIRLIESDASYDAVLEQGYEGEYHYPYVVYRNCSHT